MSKRKRRFGEVYQRHGPHGLSAGRDWVVMLVADLYNGEPLWASNAFMTTLTPSKSAPTYPHGETFRWVMGHHEWEKIDG